MLNQMDMFDVIDSAFANSFVGGGFLPVAEEFEGDAERMTKYKPTLSGNITMVSAAPFEIGGGWVTFNFKLDNGEDVYFRLNPNTEMRFPDERAKTLEFEVRTYGDSYLLCVTGVNRSEPAPLFVLDMDMLLEVFEKSKKQGVPISEYPTYRYSHIDAYKLLTFDEVFAEEGVSKHRLFIGNFDRLNLVFTTLIEELIHQNVLHESSPFYRIKHIEGDIYRLDINYDQIIGGGTLCFFEAHDLSGYIQVEDKKSSKTVVANPVVKRTVAEELALLVVKDESRILLPSEELANYTAIKRLLEEADGKYENGGFNFKYGGASDVYEALVSGEKVIKRRKAFNFFETKGEWAQNVVDAVVIKPGMRVAEFHAGHGAISDLVRNLGVEPIVNELWEENANVLLEKGYRDVLQMDFLAMTEADINGKVDVIVGNPPWERLSDVCHFNHAMTLLADGGSISMLMSPSYKKSPTKKAKAFREFLKMHDATETDVPSGSFENTKMPGVHIVISDYSPA